MTRTSLAITLIAAGVLAVPPPSAFAADPGNADWPCVQRKVTALTSAQMWDGPPVDDMTQWSSNEAVSKLVPKLTSRRVPLNEAAAAIAAFAAAQPPDKRDEALTQLYAGLLTTANTDRAVVLGGIERFQQRQRARGRARAAGRADPAAQGEGFERREGALRAGSRRGEIQLGCACLYRAPAVSSACLRGADADRAAAVRTRPRNSLADEGLKPALPVIGSAGL